MKDDSIPAFPSHGTMGEVAHPGMSLRDWFAGMAMAGFSACLNAPDGPTGLSEAAYIMADAMLKERAKKC